MDREVVTKLLEVIDAKIANALSGPNGGRECIREWSALAELDALLAAAELDALMHANMIGLEK